MSNEIDDLLNELTGDPGRARSPVDRRRRPFLIALAVLGGALATAAVAAGGFWLGARNLDESPTAAGPTTERVDATAERVTAPASSSPTTTAPQGATLPTAAPSLPPIEATDDNPNAAIRYAVFSQGRFHLRGYVRSREDADLIVELVSRAAGPDNVVDEYVIDPAAPAEVAAPVYIEDVILFDLGSAELRPEYYELLGIGPRFLALNPKLKITVVARTDASGPADANLDLARRRADAVIDYFLDLGIDPSQLEADPRGEEGFDETDDPAAAALQRRIEFVVSGLFE